eukprot:2530494-Amphidinium_carterae.2
MSHESGRGRMGRMLINELCVLLCVVHDLLVGHLQRIRVGGRIPHSSHVALWSQRSLHDQSAALAVLLKMMCKCRLLRHSAAIDERLGTQRSRFGLIFIIWEACEYAPDDHIGEESNQNTGSKALKRIRCGYHGNGGTLTERTC